MTIIHMKQTRKGSNDGLSVETYQKNTTYEVSYTLAIYFTSNGWAEIDKYSSIKETILSNNRMYKDEKIRNYWNQSSVDQILNSDLEERQKIELLSLTKIQGEDNE